MTTSMTPALSQDFDTAWHQTFHRHRDLIALLYTMIAATDAGARAVPVENIAARLGRSVPDTERLFTEVAPGGTAWAKMRHEAGQTVFEMDSHSDRPRFTYDFGDRVIGADGCAPDIFLVALAVRRPLHVESVCPVTANPIRIDFDATGVVSTHPQTTVVAMIHPQSAPEAFLLNDKAKVDADICLQQPMFATRDAASAWLAAHPGGKVFPPGELFSYLDRIIGQIVIGHR